MGIQDREEVLIRSCILLGMMCLSGSETILEKKKSQLPFLCPVCPSAELTMTRVCRSVGRAGEPGRVDG